MYINKRKNDKMTNKEVLQNGNVVQDYPIDQNPFTGEQESNGGIENLVVYGNIVYSVLTDFTGSIADPDGDATIVTDDAEGFMKTMFYLDESDIEEITEDQAEHYLQEYEDWEMDQYRGYDDMGTDW